MVPYGREFTIFNFTKLVFQQDFLCFPIGFQHYDSAEKIIFDAYNYKGKIYNYPAECKCPTGLHGTWCDQQNQCTCQLGIGSNGTDCLIHGSEHCQSCSNPDHDRGYGVCSENIHFPVIDADLEFCNGTKQLHNDFGILRPMSLKRSRLDNKDVRRNCSWDIQPTTNSAWQYKVVMESKYCFSDLSVEIGGRKYCDEKSTSKVWNVMDSGSSLHVELESDYYYDGEGFTLVWMPSDINCLANTTCSACPENEEYRKYTGELDERVNKSLNSIIMVIQKFKLV